MKSSIKYIFSIILILCSSAAGAKITRMQTTLAQEPVPAVRTTNVIISEPTAQDPGYEQSNSMLNRRIAINATPYSTRQQPGSNAAALPRRASALGGSRTPNGGLGTGNGFGNRKPEWADSGNRVNNGGHLNFGGNGVGNGGSSGSNNGNGDNRHPGETSPLGDYLLPMLILLLCYSLFLLVRGEAREEREEEMA